MDTRIDERLREAAASRRTVFLAGLPGTGKSFFVHRLAHLAHEAGRPVHLLQWDVARPVFEATAEGRRYPMTAGITHPVIRKAAGLWVRRALAEWDRHHPEPAHLLIGETPLVGHRFIELARSADDAAEPLLAGPGCLFLLPVPSAEVRRALEEERGGRTARSAAARSAMSRSAAGQPALDRTMAAREREDATLDVLRGLWKELAVVARHLDHRSPRAAASATYDPDVYERVYRHVLAHREMGIIRVERLSLQAPLSVYVFGFPKEDLVPSPGEAAGWIRAVEGDYPDLVRLRHEVRDWYVV